MLIYKILLPAEWAEFEAAGRFDGSPFDHASGFVHCSTREQVPGTVRRFFADQSEIVVVALDAERFGATLRWEDSSDGGRFPHVYGPLPRSAVTAVHPVAGTADVAAALSDS